MGVKAIDDIAQPLKSVLQDLEGGKVNESLFQLKSISTSNVLYVIKKSVSDLEYLSENLKSRGFRDNSLWGRLKQAFAGLFGGW